MFSWALWPNYGGSLRITRTLLMSSQCNGMRQARKHGCVRVSVCNVEANELLVGLLNNQELWRKWLPGSSTSTAGVWNEEQTETMRPLIFRLWLLLWMITISDNRKCYHVSATQRPFSTISPPPCANFTLYKREQSKAQTITRLWYTCGCIRNVVVSSFKGKTVHLWSQVKAR